MKLILFLLSLFTLFVNSHDKFIVVTTIQSPTMQIKKLSKIHNWHLIVVGDKKTPKDWFCENCTYLSPEKQISLGYKISNLLPWNHYSRKNIGYLYAIQNGAKIIYDTDDDNEPLFDLNPPDKNSTFNVISTSTICVNIYSYFGKPHIWPRGLPLINIKDSFKYNLLPPKSIELGITQGIVNGDPDVDAIFRPCRLTQLNNNNIYFESKEPCILETGKYCPINSQNTFFYQKAFFSLYLPSTVSMRVADIWRGYIAQRLISDLSLYVAFMGPNAFQIRNDHNLMHDFSSEQDLFFRSAEFIDILVNWKCDSQDILKKFEILISELIKKQFFNTEELKLCNAWIEDLSNILSK